jgi:hypothetical protein
MSGVGRDELSHKAKDNCDIMNFMTGLDLNSRQQTAILLAWQPGLKARGRCYDCEKCKKDFAEKVKEVKAQNPKNFGAYLVKTIGNFITGE